VDLIRGSPFESRLSAYTRQKCSRHSRGRISPLSRPCPPRVPDRGRSSMDAIEFLRHCDSIVRKLGDRHGVDALAYGSVKGGKKRNRGKPGKRRWKECRRARARAETKRGMKGKEKAKKCLTRAMHNGERRNPLAGVPRNKYAPFVLVRGGRSAGRRQNGKGVAAVKGRRKYRASGRGRERRRMSERTNIPPSSSSSSSSLKRSETEAVFSRDIIHYLKRLLSLSRPL